MDGAAAEFGSWILGSMSSGVVAIDACHNVVVMNEGARRILGCSERDVAAGVGSDCRKLLGNQPAVAELLIDALSAHSPLSRAELVLEAVGERREGTIGFTLSPVRDGNNRVCGAAILFRDLTPFERMDEQERLRDRLTALGQMAADLAHEIRNPLASMQVIADLLRRRLDGRPDDQGLIDQIVGELGSVAKTVTKSLEFVHPAVLERAPVAPVSLVEEALATALSRVEFRGSVTRNYEADLPRVNVDAEQIRSVITNLLVNALESMRDSVATGDARLTLTLAAAISDRNLRRVRLGADGQTARAHELSRRELVVAVADTGAGVAAELREKIFYPFFTTKQRGSGIGLAAAQKIVASHGGIIELDPEPGRGATFRIRLPLADANPERPDRERPDRERPGGERPGRAPSSPCSASPRGAG